MTKESFNFDEFLKAAGNPDSSDARKLLMEDVANRTEIAMGEVAPRIWSILFDQMMEHKSDDAHLNAVLNAALFSVMSWMVACTPKETAGGYDQENDIREKVVKNLDTCFEKSRDNATAMVAIAKGVGKLKLMSDSHATLAQVLTANSMVIQGLHTTMKNQGKGKSGA